MKPMKVLIACEESQVVCKAFRERGHEAYSCDIQECSGGHPEWHIHGDVIDLLYYPESGFFSTQDGKVHCVQKWDMIIGFPPCTYISNAGARYLWAGGKLNIDRYNKGLLGKEFFLKILNANCDKICVENPVSSLIYQMPKHSQEVQPFHFGHAFTKKTRLWLKGLRPLIPTEVVTPKMPYVNSSKAKIKGQYGSKKTAKEKSKTFPGIAKAMATQWSEDLTK